MQRRWSIALGIAGIAGCRGGAGAPPDGPDAVPDAFDDIPRAGQVRLESYDYVDVGPDSSYGVVSAQFGFRTVPWPDVGFGLGVVVESGPCRLVSAAATTPCAAGCDLPDRCLPDGTCVVGNNGGLDAGVVTITGGRDPYALAFHEGYVTGNDDTVFDGGATIRARADGGSWQGDDCAGFDVTGTAPEPLDFELVDGVLPLSDTEPTVLRWTPSAIPGARYAVRIGNSYSHGGSSTIVIACDGPDTGEVAIAPEIAAAMVPLEVPNCQGLTCAAASLRRYTLATAPTADGMVELDLRSTRYFWASH